MRAYRDSLWPSEDASSRLLAPGPQPEMRPRMNRPTRLIRCRALRLLLPAFLAVSTATCNEQNPTGFGTPLGDVPHATVFVRVDRFELVTFTLDSVSLDEASVAKVARDSLGFVIVYRQNPLLTRSLPEPATWRDDFLATSLDAATFLRGLPGEVAIRTKLVYDDAFGLLIAYFPSVPSTDSAGRWTAFGFDSLDTVLTFVNTYLTDEQALFSDVVPRRSDVQVIFPETPPYLVGVTGEWQERSFATLDDAVVLLGQLSDSEFEGAKLFYDRRSRTWIVMSLVPAKS